MCVVGNFARRAYQVREPPSIGALGIVVQARLGGVVVRVQSKSSVILCALAGNLNFGGAMGRPGDV